MKSQVVSIVRGTHKWLVVILSKGIISLNRQLGVHLEHHRCSSSLVMGTCNLVHIPPSLLNITCLSQPMVGIRHHILTRHQISKLSKQLQELDMITMVSNSHRNSSQLGDLLLLLITIATTIVSHHPTTTHRGHMATLPTLSLPLCNSRVMGRTAIPVIIKLSLHMLSQHQPPSLDMFISKVMVLTLLTHLKMGLPLLMVRKVCLRKYPQRSKHLHLFRPLQPNKGTQANRQVQMQPAIRLNLDMEARSLLAGTCSHLH